MLRYREGRLKSNQQERFRFTCIHFHVISYGVCSIMKDRSGFIFSVSAPPKYMWGRALSSDLQLFKHCSDLCEQWLRIIANRCLMLLNHIQYNTHFLYASHSHGAVAWGTMLQVGRSQFRFSMRPFAFSIDLSLPAALWPWFLLSL
jgi:hypothetical protein